jgi:hypothetical protein
MRRSLALLATLVFGFLFSQAHAGQSAVIDPEAAKANPDFLIQGEYTKDGEGLQIAALGASKFYSVKLKGGLPGQGWDAKTILGVTSGDVEATKKLIVGYTRVERESPTLNAKPPEKAIVLFDGKNSDEWLTGKVENDLLCEGTKTKRKFKSFTLHLEFRMPFKPDAALGGQDRGNSGVYIFDRYEVQVLDAFGLHYYPNTHDEASWASAFTKDLGFKPPSNRTQWTAAMYHFKTPDLNMCFPPLRWQTYDITFTAPKFEADKKVSNAHVTVMHNGVKVQDNVELKIGTGGGGNKPEVPEECIYLQGHGNPVRYRNIWIVPAE